MNSEGNGHTFRVTVTRWVNILMKLVERFLFLRFSPPPSDRWCGVSGSATIQIFRKASHLWWIFCPSVYSILICICSVISLDSNIRDSTCTPTGVYGGVCRLLSIRLTVSFKKNDELSQLSLRWISKCVL